MARTVSPLEVLRAKLGYSRTDFAAALGISMTSIVKCETGATLNPRLIFHALEKMGYDVTALRKEQEEWLRKRQEELRRGLVAKIKKEK